MSTYVPLPRRRREGVTDYRSRKRAITSRATLLVVRISNKNVSSQFVTPKVGGDVVVRRMSRSSEGLTGTIL